MIKFTLKRRITGAKLKELKKIAKRSEEVITDNPVWGKTISYKPIPYRRDYSMDHNKPVGRKYPPALYEINKLNTWQAEALAKKFKKNKEYGKLKRLYKLQPEVDPKVIREKEHKEAIRKWQQKLKANELIQNQNRRK